MMEDEGSGSSSTTEVESVIIAICEPEDIELGLDLIHAAQLYLGFLHNVAAHPALQQPGPVLDLAIQRYEKYWLPLAGRHPEKALAAPLDIQWVWHCHMLAPIAYYRDCHKLVGRLVDGKIRNTHDTYAAAQESSSLWRAAYPNIQFRLDSVDDMSPDPDFVSQLSYDVASAALRQTAFHYQVSMPHYHDRKYLEGALKRYKMFLFLKQKHPDAFLVPCYDIDLIWHAHQLHPLIYKYDTERLFGRIFNHDDSVNDRSPGSRLSIANAHVRDLWKGTFNENFARWGAMYRGEPSHAMLHQMSREDISSIATKKATVYLETTKLDGLPNSGGQFKLKIWYKTGYQNFNKSLFVTEKIKTLKGIRSKMEMRQRVMENFNFNSKYNDNVYVDLFHQTGNLCFGSEEKIGEGSYKLFEAMQPLLDRGLTTTAVIGFQRGITAELGISMPPPEIGSCVLSLIMGQYETCIMPENIQQMWGPIPLPILPPGVENTCSVASHRLVNHLKTVSFTCRIIHSLPLMMSAVHVFFHDKLAAVSHLVGSDQLPLPSMVTERCVTLNPGKGERAVLIKNHKGDWGFVIGSWTGAPKGIASKREATVNAGSPGHLEVRFYKMAARRWERVSFERAYSAAITKFTLDAATVELDQGLIEVGTRTSEVAENLALAFSVALLQVLCQPRPKGWKPGMTAEENLKLRIPVDDLMLVVAAGFIIATPSNHYIRTAHGTNACAGCMADSGMGKLDDMEPWDAEEASSHHDITSTMGEGEQSGDNDTVDGWGTEMSTDGEGFAESITGESFGSSALFDFLGSGSIHDGGGEDGGGLSACGGCAGCGGGGCGGCGG